MTTDQLLLSTAPENVQQVALARMAEKIVLAHRYLYYVLTQPIVTDRMYDTIEKNARKILETIGVDESPIFLCGSDLASSYSDEVKALAVSLRHQAELNKKAT